MNKNYYLVWFALLIVLLPSGSRSFRRVAELAKRIVLSAANRQSDERRQTSKCAAERCNLAINISALAESREFWKLVDNLESLEVLHIRFDGARVPSNYDRYRGKSISDSSEIEIDTGSGRVEKIALPNIERSFEWDVFDPLWWMWAISEDHFIFRMPFLDLDICSVGIAKLEIIFFLII